MTGREQNEGDHHPERVRLLVVEDSPTDAAIVEDALREAQEHRFDLHLARSLGEALEALGNDGDFDVILLDLGLPDSGGLDTLRAVRAAADGIPIVVLTGMSDDAMAMRALDAGAHDYLDKEEVHPVTIKRALSFAFERRRRTEIAHLRSSLQKLSAVARAGFWHSVPPTPGSDGDNSILSEHYARLIIHFVHSIKTGSPLPQDEVEAIAGEIGRRDFGSRHLVELHVRTLEQLVRNEGAADVRNHTQETRLLLLNVMGALLEYYRAIAGGDRP